MQWVARGGCNGLHPEVTNEVTSTANTDAAAVLPAAVSPLEDSQQQQQIKSEQRIEGLIASLRRESTETQKTRSWTLTFESGGRHRRRMQIDVDDLQRLADELQDEIGRAASSREAPTDDARQLERAHRDTAADLHLSKRQPQVGADDG